MLIAEFEVTRGPDLIRSPAFVSGQVFQTRHTTNSAFAISQIASQVMIPT